VLCFEENFLVNFVILPSLVLGLANSTDKILVLLCLTASVIGISFFLKRLSLGSSLGKTKEFRFFGILLIGLIPFILFGLGI